jgi:hypothetical protein
MFIKYIPSPPNYHRKYIKVVLFQIDMLCRLGPQSPQETRYREG